MKKLFVCLFLLAGSASLTLATAGPVAAAMGESG